VLGAFTLLRGRVASHRCGRRLPGNPSRILLFLRRPALRSRRPLADLQRRTCKRTLPRQQSRPRYIGPSAGSIISGSTWVCRATFDGHADRRQHFQPRHGTEGQRRAGLVKRFEIERLRDRQHVILHCNSTFAELFGATLAEPAPTKRICLSCATKTSIGYLYAAICRLVRRHGCEWFLYDCGQSAATRAAKAKWGLAPSFEVPVPILATSAYPERKNSSSMTRTSVAVIGAGRPAGLPPINSPRSKFRYGPRSGPPEYVGGHLSARPATGFHFDMAATALFQVERGRRFLDGDSARTDMLIRPRSSRIYYRASSFPTRSKQRGACQWPDQAARCVLSYLNSPAAPHSEPKALKTG